MPFVLGGMHLPSWAKPRRFGLGETSLGFADTPPFGKANRLEEGRTDIAGAVDLVHGSSPRKRSTIPDTLY